MGAELTALECRQLGPSWTHGLVAFFRDLSATGETRFFTPHPFSEEAIDRLAHHTGRDLYYVLVDGDSVLGYGLLRGWDEGYEIPSLGIAIHPSCRRAGLGKALMHFLHAAAARRGARQVRLRVNHDNVKARTLYEALGYRFQPDAGGYLLGFIDLGESA